jgi:LysR family transcriptional regulator, regulator for metE and metH
MNNLELKHLRMVCALAENSTMTRAAEKLYISQSALSQQLKDIETKLGIDLFFRTRKRMIITEAGKQLQRTAIEVIEAIDLAERTISRKMKGEKGELKVGTQCIFCYKWLPQVLQQFHAKFPNIEIEVGNSSDLLEELESKRYDLIISGAISPDETLTSVPLFKDQLVCIMNEDHPLASCSFIQLDDFGKNNLISHSDKSRNRFYQQILKPKCIEPKKVMNVGAPQAIVEMVAAGFGISIFPRWALADTIKTLRLVARPITSRGFPLTWHAVYLTHSNIPMYQQEFIRGISQLNVTEKSIVTDHQAEGNFISATENRYQDTKL